MTAESASTPLMKQYWDIKSSHPDKILLFRMGDFFEMFFDDAVIAAPLAGIALTSRNKKGGDETPMCGVPHHSIAGPINKLLAAGYKVAICDQIEDPKMAKGLVKRAVTRILTPGMVYDLETLEGGRAHYLASFDENVLALADTSTGECFWITVAGDRDLARWWSGLPIAELVLKTGVDIPAVAKHVLISRHDDKINQQGLPAAAQRLSSYIRELSGIDIMGILRPFEERKISGRMFLSGTVLRHLEIFQNNRGETQGSLFSAVDRTQSPAGRRLWRQWLTYPLTDRQAVLSRQEKALFWVHDQVRLKRVRQILGKMGDLERRLGKVALPTCGGRDLLALAESLLEGIATCELAHVNLEQKIGDLRRLAEKILKTLVEEPPLSTKQGYLFRAGVSTVLDELILLSTNANELLSQMEADEREKTGISSLKIRYNNVFGYYIEITNTHKEKVPSRYQRKQTLANAERYCTDELVELERKVLSAQSRRAELESELFESLRRDVLGHAQFISILAGRTAEVDVYSSLAWLSLEQKYCLPEFVDGVFTLKSSRHPVVEQMVAGRFTPNDIHLLDRGCLLLTGPNMAGKSTLMRQVALTSILAQAGSFVPAQSAKIPFFDAIFTRIGASDQLSEGLSTFMVEMTETAHILKEATERSLVILDEIGRGTSTYDGMSLAQALLEYLLSDLRCLTLFATHYHELTGLESVWPQILNAHMSVVEKNGDIRFLHTLANGPATKSYGIQVAQLAGIPVAVTKRAQNILRDRETTSMPIQLDLLSSSFPKETNPTNQLQSEEISAAKQMLAEIRSVRVAEMTPLQALNQLAEWRERCPELS